jgi:hypothetical protein
MLGKKLDMGGYKMNRMTNRQKSLKSWSNTSLLQLLENERKNYKWYKEQGQNMACLISVEFIRDIKNELDSRS